MFLANFLTSIDDVHETFADFYRQDVKTGIVGIVVIHDAQEMIYARLDNYNQCEFSSFRCIDEILNTGKISKYEDGNVVRILVSN